MTDESNEKQKNAQPRNCKHRQDSLIETVKTL